MILSDRDQKVCFGNLNIIGLGLVAFSIGHCGRIKKITIHLMATPLRLVRILTLLYSPRHTLSPHIKKQPFCNVNKSLPIFRKKTTGINIYKTNCLISGEYPLESNTRGRLNL